MLTAVITAVVYAWRKMKSDSAARNKDAVNFTDIKPTDVHTADLSDVTNKRIQQTWTV